VNSVAGKLVTQLQTWEILNTKLFQLMACMQDGELLALIDGLLLFQLELTQHLMEFEADKSRHMQLIKSV